MTNCVYCGVEINDENVYEACPQRQDELKHNTSYPVYGEFAQYALINGDVPRGYEKWRP